TFRKRLERPSAQGRILEAAERLLECSTSMFEAHALQGEECQGAVSWFPQHGVELVNRGPQSATAPEPIENVRQLFDRHGGDAERDLNGLFPTHFKIRHGTVRQNYDWHYENIGVANEMKSYPQSHLSNGSEPVLISRSCTAWPASFLARRLCRL